MQIYSQSGCHTCDSNGSTGTSIYELILKQCYHYLQIQIELQNDKADVKGKFRKPSGKHSLWIWGKLQSIRNKVVRSFIQARKKSYNMQFLPSGKSMPCDIYCSPSYASICEESGGRTSKLRKSTKCLCRLLLDSLWWPSTGIHFRWEIFFSSLFST